MKIFLFDMDGVLLESHGYHRALQETVRRMALALGFGEATLSADDIAAFESGGITSEWDEAAISTALLLETVWQDEPGRGLPASLADPLTVTGRVRPAPDFNAVARRLSAAELLRLPPLERAARRFLDADRLSSSQRRILQELLAGARHPSRSLTHRTFQELVLGSEDYARAYGFQAVLNSESYLSKYDRSNLSPEDAARLREWMSLPGQAAVVITSRPSQPPAGVLSTPEAELGTKLVGLEGIPVLGWGGISWLGKRKGIDPQTFLKPSPVHALAGLRMARGDSQEDALTAASELAETGREAGCWQEFAGAEVSVFEDTPGGIKSLEAARQALGEAGIRIETRAYGIAPIPVKIQSLRACGAQVFPSLDKALSEVFKSSG